MTADETRFWPLKKGTPSDKEFTRLADNIQQDWKRLGAALGLKEKHLNAIEMDNPNDVYERALAVLQKWKTKMGRKATYDKLAEALDDQLVQRPGLVKAFSTDNEDYNIWKLKAGIPTDQELQSLSQEIPDDWKRIGRAVGLKEKHLKIIEIDNADDVCERALATLYKWKEKQGREATYGKLAAALDDDLVQRRDLVEEYCCDIFPNYRFSQDGLHLLSEQAPQDEKDGEAGEERIRPRRKSTWSKEEQNMVHEKQPLRSPMKEENSSFQETLRTWKKRESYRGTKGRTPSRLVRQSKVSTASEEQLELTAEIQQIKGTMESAMQRMDAVLHRVQSSSTAAPKSPVVLLQHEDVIDKSQSYQEVVKSMDGKNSERAVQNDNKEESMNKEFQKDNCNNEANCKFKRDMGEENEVFMGEADESPDSLLEELPSSSRAFASYLWRWFVG